MRVRKLWAAALLGAVALLALAGPAGAQEEGDHEQAARECLEILEGGGDLDDCAEAPNPIVLAAQEEGEEEHSISHAAEECIHILEDGGEVDDCHEAPNPILPELNEIIWGALAFMILFFALARFALPPVRQAMEDRSERIRDSLDEAERTREEAGAVLADYQRQLADARSEASRIIEEARQTADSLKRDLTARAEAEAAELRQRNVEQIAAERERVMAEIQDQVATLAIELAEKVVESSLDRETNMRLIESYINEVARSGATTGGTGAQA